MSLALSKILIKEGRTKRTERAAEAQAWPGGTQAQRTPYIMWTDGEYEVSLNKPGKEAAPEYMACRYKNGTRGNNPSDMLPIVRKRGDAAKNISFGQVFTVLLRTFDESKRDAARLFGTLLVRSAFMADHQNDHQGHWRYVPPKDTIAVIEAAVPAMYGVSTIAFLHYLDCLAWNEDVKYQTLGFNIRQSYGRYNNLMTYAHVVAGAIGAVDMGDVLGGFSQPPPGVAAISRENACRAFPALGPYPIP